MADRRGISGKALARRDNRFGTPIFMLHYNSTTSSGTSNTDIILDAADFPFRVIRAWIHLTEAAGSDSEDAKLTDGTNDITDTMDYSAGSDNDAFEWSSYDDAHVKINKGEALKLVKTATTAVTSFECYVMCIRA